tara:strand:+ start:922 stop:1479 length:558 start_codon:yes stop_codon:yes gene_type:complete
MPNAILRAGPFAALGDRQTAVDSFVSNEGDNFSGVPVNCNIRDWVGTSWKYLVVTNVFTNPQTQEVFIRNSGTNVTVDSDAIVKESFPGTFEYEGIYFCYQAAQSFTLAGTFEASGSTGQQDDIIFGIGHKPNFGRYFSFNCGNDASGSFSITLPSAVVPKVCALTFLGGIDPTGRITITGINPT